MKRVVKKSVKRETRQSVLILRTDKSMTGFCPICKENALFVQPSYLARFFGLSERRIFRSIENGDVHFNEDDAGQMLICLNSLSRTQARQVRIKASPLAEGIEIRLLPE